MSSGTPDFIPGLELSRLFYEQAVGPLLEQHFSGLKYSAALIGHGSDVVGFDTATSMDHDWGPRLLLFLSEDDHAKHADAISAMLAEKLPRRLAGFSTHFCELDELGTQWMIEPEDGPVRHRVKPHTVRGFFSSSLGIDPHEPITPARWLTMPQQELLAVTAGEVFHDGLGELEPIRAGLAWYPHDVWLYLMACQWGRIAQERGFVGRAGEVGDELGSAIIAARLVRELMRLCFLMEKRYASYGKWLGTAFSRLRCGDELRPVFVEALAARDWKIRERHLAKAYTLIAAMHNKLDVTAPLPTQPVQFYGRPYVTVDADAFVKALREAIRDPAVRAIKLNIGSVDQFLDSTDALTNATLCAKMFWILDV